MVYFFLVIRCLQTVDIANGKVESPQKEEYEYGEVVQYSCDNDYALIGSSSLTCGENGKFEPPPSSSPPSCVCKQSLKSKPLPFLTLINN